MRSVHIGDIHLKIPEKNEEFYIKRFLDLTDKIQEEDPSEILLTGDVFDKHPTALEAALMLGWIQQFDCPVLIVEGNHDRTNRKSKRANYLENLLTLLHLPKVVFAGDKIIDWNDYRLVSNRVIRRGDTIPLDKTKILLSHIRHELNIAGTKKKAEYDINKLSEGFNLCLFSDIHTTFKYMNNVFYSTSPWRTNKKTITNLTEIDDKFFGYNVIEQGVITHVDCNLPNHYNFKSSEKVANSQYAGIVDVEYEITIEDIENFKGENIKIKHEDSDIEVHENLFELVYSILEEEYSIKKPKKYMDLLIDVVGEI